MSDIVERLSHLQYSLQYEIGLVDEPVVRDAIDEIERLRGELADWQRTVRAHEHEKVELLAALNQANDYGDLGQAMHRRFDALIARHVGSGE